MTTTINASTSAGLIQTADTSGILALQTANTTAITIDASQNMGLGVVPSAWAAGENAFESRYGYLIGTLGINVARNAYYSSTGWKYIGTGNAECYQQTAGTHVWRTAPSGTAGNAITFTQAMTLDASGQLQLGTTSNFLSLNREVSMNAASGTVGVSMGVGGTLQSLFYSSTSATYIGTNSATPVIFQTGGSEKARIDSSGNLSTTSGYISGASYIKAATYLWAAGTSAGSNGVYLGIGTATGCISQTSQGLGTVTTYIGNQSITTSSDIRLKENVKPSERNAIDLLNQWEIIDHTWNDPSDQCENNRNSRGVWTGVSAQQVQQVTPWLVNKPLEDVNDDGTINIWTMDFGYAVPLLVKAIQELKADLDATKAELAALKGQA